MQSAKDIFSMHELEFDMQCTAAPALLWFNIRS